MKKENNNNKLEIKQKNGIIEMAKNGKNEFMEFVKSYNIVGMAIGIVVGNSVKDLVTSLASNLIMPLIGLVTPSGSYQDISIVVKGADFKIGVFLASLLDFVIIALVVFIVVKKIFRIEINK